MTLDGSHFIIPGYKSPRDPGVEPSHWKFFVLSGIFLLSLMGLLRGSVRPLNQKHTDFSGFLMASAIVLTLALLAHFFFTVCS